MTPPPRPSPTTPEALDALRERLRATQEAAGRLAEEATRDRPPSAGWDVPRHAEDANAEVEALLRVLGLVRDLVPPELRAQLADLARQLLVFVRAVLDWWIDRLELEGRRGDETPVEDIPIA